MNCLNKFDALTILFKLLTRESMQKLCILKGISNDQSQCYIVLLWQLSIVPYIILK